MRKFRFANGEYYHVYNRGVDKRTVFLDQYDFERFFQSIEEFNSLKPIGSLFENSFRNLLSNPIAKLVDVMCYCLNPNHYHMILRQRVNNGISEFMRRIGTGFTQHFNFKYNRSGALFQGKFKAKHINSNKYLLHLSAYINLNNKAHKINGGAAFRSSWNEYVLHKPTNHLFCDPSVILNQFGNIKEYRQFAENSLDSILARKQMFKEMKELLLD